MPFYRITVFVKNKQAPVTGIRELVEYNIERAWQLMEAKAKEAYNSDLEGFNLMMISKRSADYKEWLEKRNKEKDTFGKNASVVSTFKLDSSGTGKYRGKNNASKPNWGENKTKE